MIRSYVRVPYLVKSIEAPVVRKAFEVQKISFRPNQIYNRRNDIHAVWKGQQQGGVATPASAPFIFIFTGEAGEQHGYSDGWDDGGVFHYTGEGQIGDMTFIRGNRAIRDHAKNGKDLLLFEATKKSGMYRFIGGIIF